MKPLAIKIDPQEALRYAGHRSGVLAPELREKFDACYAQVSALVRPRIVTRVFPIEGTRPVRLTGTALVLPGRDIGSLLSGAHACVLMAVTIGGEVEQAIRSAQVKDLTGALFLDGCASAAVEAVCEAAEAQLRARLGGPPPFFTRRFSPGYGDLPLTLQQPVLQVLDAGRKIGLFVSDSGLLTPRKSVTAILGLREKEAVQGSGGCEACGKRDTCTYRKEGISCE